jgi:hypothetical protein
MPDAQAQESVQRLDKLARQIEKLHVAARPNRKNGAPRRHDRRQSLDRLSAGWSARMTTLLNYLLPTLANRLWAEVNLNDEAAKRFPLAAYPENPLHDLDVQNEFVRAVAKEAKADFTYGGYLEWRGDLWRGFYMKPNEMVHVGVDYNAPAGTLVTLPVDAVLVRSEADPDQDGGWGGRLIFHRPASDSYFVIGHLAHANRIQPELEGCLLRQGAEIGRIGESFENGNWFAHLHVQCISRAEYDATQGGFDGYVAPSVDLSERYPPPSIGLA